MRAVLEWRVGAVSHFVVIAGLVPAIQRSGDIPWTTGTGPVVTTVEWAGLNFVSVIAAKAGIFVSNRDSRLRGNDTEWVGSLVFPNPPDCPRT